MQLRFRIKKEDGCAFVCHSKYCFFGAIDRAEPVLPKITAPVQWPVWTGQLTKRG